MITSPKLAYESPFQPPSELDHKFEIAWAKSLRRRFLWYCGVVIVLAIPELLLQLSLIALMFFSFKVNIGSIAVSLSELVLSRSLYVAAWWYTFRRPPKRKTILAIAFWLYVVTSVSSLLIARFQVAPDSVLVQSTAASQPTTAEAHEGKLLSAIRQLSKPSTQAAVKMNRPSPAHVFAWAAPFGIFANHIFLCFFLPWSFEQSVRPAMIILPVATAISLGDLLIGNTGLTSLLTPVLVVMAFVPGSVWCWWRFSKFRSGFKMYYESSAFQQLQLELGNARRIHESQLPAVRSTGPLQMYYAYEPMRQIGGDLLFSFPPADIATDKLTAVVLDVTGHGVAAALFVNRLVGELERCFGENPDATPDDVLAALNGHVFYTLAKHSMYATAIAAQIDLTQNTLTYASAGHPDAFLRFANMPCERLVSTACMLGVIDPKSYDGQQVTRPFETGSSVVLYTDGAMEARNHETGKSLGMEGLQSIMQSLTPGLCSAWPQQVLSQVTVHRQAPPDDDTLIVALCRV